MAKQSLLLSRSAGRRFQKQVKEYDTLLRNTCETLAAQAASGKEMSPAAAWLLDNYMFVHGQAQAVGLGIPPGFFSKLPRASGEAGGEWPRAAVVADAIVNASDGALTSEAIRIYLRTYQRSTPLTLAELWALEALLKLVLIRRLCQWIAAGLTDSPESEAAVRNSIGSLRKMEALQWREVVEAACLAERILREDPAGVYDRMDFATRDRYRREVEQLARGSWYREERVAEIVLEMAREEAGARGRRTRESHVGYFLIGAGRDRLKSRLGYRRGAEEVICDLVRGAPNFFYIGAVAVITSLLVLAAARVLRPMPWWFALLLAIPASQGAVSVVNHLVSLIIRPQKLPRMDFSDGIPPSCRTFVVVPTLLLSRAEALKLLERLEIHYLASRDPNLLFALLTDFPDGDSPEGDLDLLRACADGIRILNRRYAQGGRGPFYLFHRSLEWNPSEGVWMGPERKRGKLNDFNSLLCGTGDAFTTKVGDLGVLSTVRYVLTLDSDTQLPRDTAQELVATIAHPLNQARVDEATGMARDGYTILQPRVTISMESASRSRLAQIYGGQPGFDPYASAVSDVYQDLHGLASFTGKGIYDVAAFDRVMQDRFPINSLLSHDLIEGEHARVGLVTDLEVVDDYPSTYESYSKRLHRWVRGDWQIAAWLLPRVPSPKGPIPNPLSLLSRWKIVDNLRRSLVEITLLLSMLVGWLVLPAGCARVTAVGIALLLVPAYAELLFSFFRVPPVRFWKTYLREVLFRFGQGHAEAAFSLALLACKACVLADAIGRTLIRVLVTRRNLLEWETMAQSEAKAQQTRSLMRAYVLACPVLALVVLTVMALFGVHVDRITNVLLALWAVTPLTVIWINGHSASASHELKTDVDFLRGVCLRTWFYFADHQQPEDHWLTPDHVQEDPLLIAHRTSPTNLGLQLTAHLAAHDMGYLTYREVSGRLHNVLDTMSRMDRFRGHFYNWYDTRTLEVLPPRYVSSVDSGNLAAALVTLKQGCMGFRNRPLVGTHTLQGLRDHVLLFRDALPPEAHTGSIMRVVASLLKQLAYVPTDLFFWEGILTDVVNLTERLKQPVGWICSHLESSGVTGVPEVCYWYDALSARARLALEELRTLAPWLAPPFETELRMSSREGSMAEIMEGLCRVPRLGDLPVQYQVIARAIRARLGHPAPLPDATRHALLDLLPELELAREAADELIGEFDRQAAMVARWVEQMDFAFLFNPRRKLLHIGSNVDTGLVDEAHYDLLASEARTAVFLAIAKGDIPRDAWFRLQRKLVGYQGHRTIVSWSGTMFEYLMPALFMRTYDHTLLGESLAGAVRVQQRYGKERNVPWGISEAACATRDHSLEYQYRAFGVPPLATDPQIGGDRLVIAPYATMLAAMVDRAEAARNLREMAGYDWVGRYGFYESVDYSRRPELVRMYMVHHQGMGLLALCNALLGGTLQDRFHADPMVVATAFLLQERLPSLIDVGEEEQHPHVEPLPSPAAVPAGALAERALPPEPGAASTVA